MSLEALLNHRCNIYHIVEMMSSPGYGLPGSPSHSYPEEPDITDQICHFGVHGSSFSINQTRPINIEDERTKLTLPLDTDVRLNDLIEDVSSGEKFIAERPVNIRDHHLFVYIKKLGVERQL